MVVYISDLVTYTNFGDHRLRVFLGGGGQISPFPIDFHRRPYNTLALPCECVIYQADVFLWCRQATATCLFNANVCVCAYACVCVNVFCSPLLPTSDPAERRVGSLDESFVGEVQSGIW